MILASKSTSGQKCGFVCYQTRTAQEMAAAAIATLGDRHCPPGVDKPIQVKVAKSSLVSTYVENKAAQTSASWLREPLSVPDRASGCHELRPASANQPLGPRWPAI